MSMVLCHGVQKLEQNGWFSNMKRGTESGLKASGLPAMPAIPLEALQMSASMNPQSDQRRIFFSVKLICASYMTLWMHTGEFF